MVALEMLNSVQLQVLVNFRIALRKLQHDWEQQLMRRTCQEPALAKEPVAVDAFRPPRRSCKASFFLGPSATPVSNQFSLLDEGTASDENVEVEGEGKEDKRDIGEALQKARFQRVRKAGRGRDNKKDSTIDELGVEPNVIEEHDDEVHNKSYGMGGAALQAGAGRSSTSSDELIQDLGYQGQQSDPDEINGTDVNKGLGIGNAPSLTPLMTQLAREVLDLQAAAKSKQEALGILAKRAAEMQLESDGQAPLERGEC